MLEPRKLVTTLSILFLLVGYPVAADVMRTNTAPGLGGYDGPFYPEGTYRDDVQSPSEFLGFELGSRPTTHAEMMRYFGYLDKEFSNAMLVEYARSYEGRELVYLTVTSNDHAANLKDVRARTSELADPRKLKNNDAKKIISTYPATAWMAYGIHGDELSSCEAALQLAYQLLAGTDPNTRLIRDQVVVCIDPMENPDGRERWLGQLEQWNSVTPSTDIQSLHHTGMWPWGRGNHYLFDLNRDWFVQVHPESRGRSRAIMQWNPQFLLDCHEMGPLNTYLFSPPREPFNPFMISQIHKWWDIYASDQAESFDRYGWSYYTREWNEEFFPGYGSSWGIYIGAIGMLYEQAGTDGSQVKRRDGTVLTYREAIHHQFTSSMANLATTARRREELLKDFYEEKKRAVSAGKTHAFVLPPTANKGRFNRFAKTLQRQSIEVETALDNFKLRRARSGMGETMSDVALPKGSLIVRLNQPLRSLIEAILTFDIRIPTDFLEIERKELLKNNRSKLYEATGWSMPLAYDLECYFTESLPNVKTKAYTPTSASGRLIGGSPRFGYVVDDVDDRSVSVLARFFEKEYRVWSAREPFQVEGKRFERGSLLIKLTGNRDLDERDLVSIAHDEGIDIYGVNTALGGELADLGGGEFVLLQTPRIALVGGPPVSTYQFGSVWHLLDSRLRYRTSTLDFARVADTDLRKYNVIVFPAGSGGADKYKRMLGKKTVKKLKTWVESGGTLIAMGDATAFFADSSVALSTVRPKRQVLEELSKYDSELAWAEAAESPVVDSLDLWETPRSEEEADEQKADPELDVLKRTKEEADRELDALKEVDELARRLRPRGTIMSVILDNEHWLAYGARPAVPLMVSTSYAYLAKKNVQVAGRFAGPDKLRLSGLLWPEARERWTKTVAVSREGRARGQVILFAVQPNFRAFFHGGERLLLNALFLGPGFGTRPSLEW